LASLLIWTVVSQVPSTMTRGNTNTDALDSRHLRARQLWRGTRTRDAHQCLLPPSSMRFSLLR